MIELQRKLIGDKVRNDAFHAALTQVIDGNSEVIDLGSGTGFLAFLCSQLGAKHITCIESGDILKTSKQLAKRNGIDNCTFIHGHSTQIKSLPKADVLVSETLGNYALEENIIESVEDAKRFLKKGAVILPSRIRQFVCPVVTERVPKQVDVWDAGYGLQFDEARAIAQNNIYVKTIRPDDLLKDGAREWDEVDFARENDSVRDGEVVWKAEKPLTVHGFALWWEADLGHGITLSTSPFGAPTHWEQIFLPLLEPVELLKDESCRIRLHSDTRWQVKINLRWTVHHLDAAGKQQASQTLDMQKGWLN